MTAVAETRRWPLFRSAVRCTPDRSFTSRGMENRQSAFDENRPTSGLDGRELEISTHCGQSAAPIPRLEGASRSQDVGLPTTALDQPSTATWPGACPKLAATTLAGAAAYVAGWATSRCPKPRPSGVAGTSHPLSTRYRACRRECTDSRRPGVPASQASPSCERSSPSRCETPR